MSEQDSSIPTTNALSGLVLPGWLMHLALVLPCAALLTSVYIQHSMSVGRLALGFPLYDDVSYFDDALERLDTFYRDGLTGLVKSHWRHHPHSPWSSYSAMVGYAVFGRVLWAPYAVNCLLLILTFFIVNEVAGRPRLWIAALLTAVLWSTPFSAALILECRPDAFCGLASAYALFLMARTPLAEWTKGHACWIGICWGVTAWIKPTIFVQTGLFCAGGLGWWWLLALRDSDRSWPRLARNSVCVVGVAVLVALPHLGRNLNSYLHYMNVNQFGERRNLWMTVESLSEHFWHYTTGPSGRFMFGGAFFVLLAVAGATFAAAFRQGRPLLARHLVTLLIFSFMCWLIPTLNYIKSPFFGMAFGALLIFTFLRCCAAWLHGEVALPARMGFAAGWSVALSFLLMWGMPGGFPAAHRELGGADAEVIRALYEEVAKQVEIARRGREARIVHVALPFTGRLNAELLSWLFRMHQVGAPTVYNCFFGEQSQESMNAFENADMVVVPEPGINGRLVYRHFLAAGTHERLLSELSEDPSFHRCAAVSTRDGTRLVLFAHDRAIKIAAADAPRPTGAH